MNPHIRNVAVPNDWDRRGLPGWSYHSPAPARAREGARVPQPLADRRPCLATCPSAGDYLTIDVVGERALIVRGKDGVIRGFHNICRHRGSRVVADEQGNCRNALVCPFHGWVYNLDGTLRGAARPHSFPRARQDRVRPDAARPRDLDGLRLLPLPPSGPQPRWPKSWSRSPTSSPTTAPPRWCRPGGIWTQKTPVNWKSVRDVDNEGYHVAMAHPALQDLYGATYFDEPFVSGVSRSFATYNPHAGRRWSVRKYIKHRARADASAGKPAQGLDLLRHLPQHGARDRRRNRCSSIRSSRCRPPRRCCAARSTATPTRAASRRAARYLAFRIDRDTMAEDVQLSVWSNESMLSDAFERLHLSDLEYGVRTHHDHLRALMPVTGLEYGARGEGHVEPQRGDADADTIANSE